MTLSFILVEHSLCSIRSAPRGQDDCSEGLLKRDVTTYDLDVPMEEFILLLQGVNIFHDDADISDPESSFDDDI